MSPRIDDVITSSQCYDYTYRYRHRLSSIAPGVATFKPRPNRNFFFRMRRRLQHKGCLKHFALDDCLQAFATVRQQGRHFDIVPSIDSTTCCLHPPSVRIGDEFDCCCGRVGTGRIFDGRKFLAPLDFEHAKAALGEWENVENERFQLDTIRCWRFDRLPCGFVPDWNRFVRQVQGQPSLQRLRLALVPQKVEGKVVNAAEQTTHQGHRERQNTMSNSMSSTALNTKNKNNDIDLTDMTDSMRATPCTKATLQRKHIAQKQDVAHKAQRTCCRC